jgi:hypothetical protein
VEVAHNLDDEVEVRSIDYSCDYQEGRLITGGRCIVDVTMSHVGHCW